jgi:hypothetical protein
MFSKYEHSQRISVLIFVLSALLIFDNILYSIRFSGNAFREQLVSTEGITLLFTVMFTSYAIGLYLLLKPIKYVIIELGLKSSSSVFNIMFRILTILQCFCAGILLLILLQIIWSSGYDVSLVILVILLNYSFASIILGILSYKFVLWYKLNKGTLVLLYAGTFAMISLGTGFVSVVNSVVILSKNPLEIVSAATSLQLKSNPSQISTDSFNNAAAPRVPNLVLLGITYTPMRVAFIVLWVASTVLLRNYSKRLGRSKFWIIVSLPLVAYLIGNLYSDYIGLNGQIHKTNLLANTLLIVSAVTAGGILFGTAFITTRNISQLRKNIVGDYLTITAYGIALLGISLTSPIVYTPYPPFSSVAWSFVALASYLFSLGFYASAISVSRDIELRNSLKVSTISVVEQQTRLLDSIGTAEMIRELETKMIKIVREQQDAITEQTGIQTSLSDEDLRSYLGEVLNEIKNMKQKSREKAGKP